MYIVPYLSIVTFLRHVQKIGNYAILELHLTLFFILCSSLSRDFLLTVYGTIYSEVHFMFRRSYKESKTMGKKNNSIPDKWEEYSTIGAVIPGTRYLVIAL